MNCPFCGEEKSKNKNPFTTLSLRQHVESCHKDEQRCPTCGKTKGIKGNDFTLTTLMQHIMDKHHNVPANINWNKITLESRKAAFEMAVDDDTPDGAYFAIAEEFGLSPEDLVDD